MKPRRDKKNWLEWTVFAAGLLLLVAVVTYLAGAIWAAENGPPDIEVQLGGATRQSGGFAVPVIVTNSGGETAEKVRVRVTMQATDGARDAGAFEVDYLPPGAKRRGVVVFEADPAGARTLRARVLGYQLP